MMSRFTEKAQEVLQRAQQIMFSKRQTQLDVEHIFLALLQQRNSLPPQIIAALGSDIENMEGQLEKALDNIPTFTHPTGSTTGYITLRANRVLTGSAEEADRLHDDFISTEHILLAVASERGGATGQILADASVDRGKVEAVIKQMRASRPPE